MAWELLMNHVPAATTRFQKSGELKQLSHQGYALKFVVCYYIINYSNCVTAHQQLQISLYPIVLNTIPIHYEKILFNFGTYIICFNRM